MPECNCGWLRCKEYRAFFDSLPNDVRGGAPIQLKLDGKSAQDATLRKGIVEYAEVPLSSSRNKILHIARHHYDPKILALLDENDDAKRASFSEEEHEKYSAVRDSTFSHSNNGGSIEYFLLPCIEEGVIAEYVDGKTEVVVVERKEQQSMVNDVVPQTNGHDTTNGQPPRRQSSVQSDSSSDYEEAHMTVDFEAEAQAALSKLQSTYGTAALEKPDVAFLMDGWNKILGWETMWKEALWFRWRILVAREELREPSVDEIPVMSQAEAAVKARHLVEKNHDPIANCFGSRTHDGKNLLLALFDEQVRSLCPHIQTVQREAYRNVSDDRGAAFGLSLECTTSKEIFRLFSTLGIQPHHYLTLCEAFLYAMESHSPYAKEDDEEDLEKSPNQSAYARFVAQLVAKPGIKDTISLREKFAAPMYSITLPKFWNFVKTEGQDGYGELFYTNLLSTYPELLDYFARADMDSLAGHIVLAVDLMVKYPEAVGVSNSSFRKVMKHLGDVHRELGIPTDAYPMIGMNLIATFKPFSEKFVEMSKGPDNIPVTQKELEQAFLAVYGPTMSFTFYPMLREEHTIAKATEFFEQAADELDWSSTKLSKRMLEVKLEINSTGTYQHTPEELQLGARLAWRNSTKCIGRISWNTLEVRDCRHVETPEGIVHEIEKHLEIATAGTNLQSVMTMFRPRGPDEPWGIRFWSDQLVRYACYTDKDDPTKTMGDTANKHFTKFLIEKGLWTPPAPEKRTQHDVLPIVFKMPGCDEPYVHQFDDKYVDEVTISHPDYPEVSKLGHKWASVPAISSFNVNIGGVDYGCMPFNGWFASIEIVRDLMERYPGANEKWAKAIGIDTSKRMWKSRIAHEIDVAVLHSFDEQGYTIVDMETVGEQFMTHCKREQEAGRECPAQWSWIGGLTGPTNATWHKEMRDFRVDPAYEYCCEMWGVTGEDEVFPEGEENVSAELSSADEVTADEAFTIPRVVIAFGSETGTAEAAAGRLARALRLCKPIVSSLNKVAGLDIIKQGKTTHLFVLCSTFGKGQPPSNAATFFKTEIPGGLLEDTKVAVLCLGSSMYPDFCQAGKTVNKMLANAGAQMMIPATTADEAVDSAGTIAQWLKLVKTLVLPDSLEAAIEARMGVANEPLKYEVKWEFQNAKAKTERYVWPVDKSSLCLINEELLVSGDITKRSTRRVGFEVPYGTSYVTGDHLAVNPLNSMELVYRFAACFESEFKAAAASQGMKKATTEELIDYMLQQSFEVDCIDNGQVYPAQMSFEPTTLAEVLQVGISLSITEASAGDLITVLKKHIPSDGPLAESNGTVKEFNELSALILEGGKGLEHQDAMNSFLSLYPTVVDLLETFVPIVQQGGNDETIPLAEILAILPRLQPRLYSISSSSMTSPTVVEISVGVVHAITNDGVSIAGVCSNYLARLEPRRDRACISIRTSSFRGPADIVNTPMIMVGAGTGLAPMIGFLEDRAYALEHEEEEKKTDHHTDCHLFFGCRTHDERIYSEKIEDWEQGDVLNLHLALSRSQDRSKMYVQDMIKEKGEIICDLLLRDDCTYYICGDANMADFVYNAIVEALREHAHMSRVKATNLLKRMRVEDRWQYDLWGISSYMDGDSYSTAKKNAAKRKANRALNWLSTMKKKTNQWEDEDDEGF